MAAFDVDLFVIGGGSGGVRAARVAANHGASVMLAEEFRMGGTCVIRGCVPKKLLVYASRYHEHFEDAEGFGWSMPKPRFDWPTLVAAKEREITRLEGLYTHAQEKAGVTIAKARAVFEEPHVLSLSDGRRVSARHVLIATGGRPNIPDVPGAEHAITSNEAFDLPMLPRHIVIAGAGYIALEFAGIFSGLGAQVTVIYRGDGILRGFDADLREMLEQAYTARGIRFIYNDVFTTIERRAERGAAESRLVAWTKGGLTLECDEVMFAIGRSPNSANLGLEKVGVALKPGGAIAVDSTSQTNVPHIYAVGDVTDRVALTPVAIREGHAVADTLFGNNAWKVDHGLIPTAVFTTPEIGTIGLSEGAARASFDVVDIYKTRFRPMKATLSGRAETVLMKIVVDGLTDRVLGVHIMGEDAGEMAQLLGISLRMGATKAHFDATMAVHPTASEELVTLRTRTARFTREAA